MPAYSFDAASVRRIARSVLYTEGVRQNPPARGKRYVTASAHAEWFRCKSAAAAELPAWGVVEVTGEEVVGELDELVYTVNKIGSTWPKRIAVLGHAAIAVGKFGALSFDPAFALCDSTNEPAANECWGIKPNETKLFKGFPGFRSLGRTLGTGAEQRAFVRQAWPQVLWAKSGGSGIPARSGSTPGSATVTIYTLASGSLASTGFTATAFNASGAAVVADKYLHVVEIEDDLVANYEDCARA